ncbi:MAG: fasciclin domain-containing protein [Pseudomonadota bacterium]
MKKLIRSVAFAATLALPLATVLADRAKADNIVETAQSAGQFNTLIAAAQAAGLDGALASDGPFTVFAPTDDAFAALPPGTVDNLLKPENRDQLAAILSYHVLPRRLSSNMLPGRTIHVRTIKSGGDRLLAVTKQGGAVTVDNANVVAADINADNGIIHVIDAVMLPQS